MAKSRQDQFVTLWVCTKTNEAVAVSGLKFEAEVQGTATPRFMVSFKGFGEDSYGAGRINQLPKKFEDPDGASGEVRPCDQIEGKVEIAFILDRDDPVGTYADGFNMTYTTDGKAYTIRTDYRFAVCASKGPNPEPIAENCKQIEKS